MLVMPVLANHAKTVEATHSTYETLYALNEQHPKAATTNAANVLISPGNPDGDDMNPKVSYGSGNILVTYEQHVSTFEVTTPLVYSDDNGATWTTAFDISYSDSSGILNSPDICYSPVAGYFFWDAIDPIGDIYNLKISRIPGDIASATDIPLYGVSGTGAEDHYTSCITWVSDISVTPYVCDEPGYDLYQCPGLGYWVGENFDHPPNIGGFYYDGGSIMQTSPANYMEAATGGPRMYMVFETELDGEIVISLKQTVTDLDLLLTSGGGPGGMDKYADIEVWPWQQQFKDEGQGYLMAPDVSASGTNVAVVYMTTDNIFGDWDIVCAHSSDSGDTWAYTTIGAPQVDETYPAVYVAGGNVYVVYVANGNLYLVESEDAGATFGAADQINTVDGTVVAQHETAKIDAGGIVWTDSRNGNMDIYFAALPTAIIEVEIAGGFGVKATVSNTGSAEATDLAWSVELSGPVFVGKLTEGSIATLAPGASQTVGPGLVLGIGPTTITASAGGVTTTASGFVLGPLVLGL
jgi:hypothetical protein